MTVRERYVGVRTKKSRIRVSNRLDPVRADRGTPALYWRTNVEDRCMAEIAGSVRPSAKQPVADEARQNSEQQAWRRHGWRLLSIWGLLLIAYSNSFQAGLVFDNSLGDWAGSPDPPGDAAKHRVHSDRRVSLLHQRRGIISALDHLFLSAELRSSRQWFAPRGLSLGQSRRACRQCCAGVCAGHRDFRRDCASVGAGRNLGIASAAHRIRNEYCGPGRLLAAFGVLAGLLCYVRARFGRGAAKAAVAGGHGGCPGGRAFLEGERRGLAGPHAALRPDVVRPHGVARARCRPMPRWRCRSRRFSIYAAKLHLHMLDRFCRQSPGERRFLDCAAHRRQSNRQVPVAVSLAGPIIGGLFLQCRAVIRLAARTGKMPRR